jgi:hypothetical protein
MEDALAHFPRSFFASVALAASRLAYQAIDEFF